MQDDLDAVAVAGQRLVDGVVDRLVDEMMQTVGAGIADVHRRTLAYRLEALQDLDVAGGVGLGAHAAPLTAVSPRALTRPPLTSHHAAGPHSPRSRSAVVKNTWPSAATCSRTRRRTPAIQLGQRVVQQEHRRATHRVPDRISLGQPERERHQPLLPARPKASEVASVELDGEIVTVRSDDRRPPADLFAEPPLERGLKIRLRRIVAERASVPEDDVATPGQCGI